ncbi:hypothetical protein BH23GEM9_BH23GEM9_29330 [soil metagenome]
MNRMSLDGVELEYDVTGSGDPVLLIGTGPIADSFVPLLSQRPLVERYRLITYHQRGQAGSTRGAPVSYADHAADADALLNHLGIDRAHVAGHSTGGVVALQLAVDRPDVVHSLVLLEPLLMGVPAAGALLEKAGPALAAYGAGDTETAMTQFLSVACSLDWQACRTVIEKHVPGGVAQAIRDADTFFGSYLPGLAGWQFGPDQAGSISQPVLSVLGTATDQLFVEGRSLLHSWFPQVEDCTIDGVAHLLHIQQPAPVARCVADFLARHSLSLSERAAGRSPSSSATPLR